MITLLLLVHVTYIWVLFFTHIPFVVNRTFNTTTTERLKQQFLLFTTNRIDCMFFLWSQHLAWSSHPGHSTILLRSESPSGMCTKASQLQQVTIEITCHDHSYCLFTPHIYIYGCFSLHTSHLWWIAHSTQCQPRGCNSAYTTYFTNHTWLLCCSSKSDMRMQCLTNCISKIYYHRCFLLPVWKHDIFNFAQNSSVTPGLQKVWKSGRSFPGNRTCSREINQLQVM